MLFLSLVLLLQHGWQFNAAGGCEVIPQVMHGAGRTVRSIMTSLTVVVSPSRFFLLLQ